MKLLDRVREVMCVCRLSRKRERACLHWIKRFLRFCATMGDDGRLIWRHPKDMDADEVRAFLTDLAVNGRVSASTQNQALAGRSDCLESERASAWEGDGGYRMYRNKHVGWLMSPEAAARSAAAARPRAK